MEQRPSRNRVSWDLYHRALRVIPGGSQMYNKRPAIYEPCDYPAFVGSAEGGRFVDVDGNEYLDYLLAYGAVILGYNYPSVRDAVTTQIHAGTVYSVNHELEIELAEELVKMIPSADMVRYFLSGSEATSAAVRIARVYTGRDKVIQWGYHGWHDWCVSGQPSPPTGLLGYFDTITCPHEALAGVPRGVAQYTREVAYNDPEEVERLLKDEGEDVACIILEPVYLTLPENGYLECLRELADEYGVVLIFDEVKTGCRIAPGGAQEYFGVMPDLSVYSKAMSNGYAFSLVAGRREVMQANEHIWYAGTNSGNLVGVTAALTTAREVQQAAFREHVWRLGRKLMTGLDTIAADVGIEAQCIGLPPMPALRFAATDELSANEMETRFLCECISRGVFFPKNHCWFICYSHTDADIDRTLEVCEAALRTLRF